MLALLPQTVWSIPASIIAGVFIVNNKLSLTLLQPFVDVNIKIIFIAVISAPLGL